MWICTSCRMENEDKDSLCYMCGTKRPHSVPVRPSAQQDVPQNTPLSPEPLPDEAEPAAFVEAQTQAAPVEEPLFLWDDEQTGGKEVIISDFIEPMSAEENTPPVPVQETTAAPQADVNLFASVFNTQPQAVPSAPTAEQNRQNAPQSDFGSAFIDFLAAIEAPPTDPVASVMQPAAPSVVQTVVPPAAPPAVQPPEEEPRLSKKEKKRRQREENRKTVAAKVCVFLRTLCIAAVCLWLCAFCLAAVMRLASASAGDMRIVFEELLFAFEQRLQDVFGNGLSGFVGELLFACGRL